MRRSVTDEKVLWRWLVTDEKVLWPFVALAGDR
jgi:hypothetical protein